MIEDVRLLATLPSRASERKTGAILSKDVIRGVRLIAGIFDPRAQERTLTVLCTPKQEDKKDIRVGL